MGIKKISPEGLPFYEYRWIHVAIALPMAVALFLICRINTFLTRDQNSEIPELAHRSLVVGFHRDLIYFFCTKTMWRDLMRKKTAWIGIHHWASYAGSLEFYFRGIRCFRFDRTRAIKPFEQILHFLRDYPFPVYMRTDAGGPYDQVKASIIRLAIESQRDLICLRQTGPAYFNALAGHRFPLPFSKIVTAYSEAISWRELEKLPLETSRKLIQEKMMSLPKDG